MTGLTGRFGISDAFMLDVLADEIREIASKLNVPLAVKIVAPRFSVTGTLTPQPVPSRLGDCVPLDEPR